MSGKEEEEVIEEGQVTIPNVPFIDQSKLVFNFDFDGI
jgi:hypothetical protein